MPCLLWLMVVAVTVVIRLSWPETAQAQAVTNGVSVTVGVGDTILQVVGKTSPSAFIRFKENNAIIGTATADAAGNFSQQLLSQSPGFHTLEIYARDSNDKLTDPVTVTVSLTQHFTTTLDVFLPSTITLSDATVPADGSVDIKGETYPHADVIVTVDDSLAFTVKADTNGRWEFEESARTFTPGDHTIYVQAKDNLGVISYATTKLNFEVVQPAEPNAIPPNIPTITFPLPGAIIDGSVITVEGTADIGSQVLLFNKGRNIGSAFPGLNGKWQIPVSLIAGAYELQVKACSEAVCSDLSEVVRFTVQSNGQAYLFSIRLLRYDYRVEQDSSVRLKLIIEGGAAPFTVTVNWGTGKLETLTTSQREIELGHIYTKAGQYTSQLYVKDAQAAERTVGFSVRVTPIVVQTGQKLNIRWVVAWFGLIGVFALLSRGLWFLVAGRRNL